jgi:hypothetical protein
VDRTRLRSELPHLKLDVDPQAMSPDERAAAALALERALAAVSPTPAEVLPGPGSGPLPKRRAGGQGSTRRR